MTVGLVAVMLLAALPDFARVAVGSAPRLIVRRAPARSAPVALTVSEIVSALPGLVGLRVLSSLAPSEIAGSIARFPPAAPADVANPPLVLPDGGRRLQLSERESELFDFLKEVAAVSGCKTTMRVAGGWVRDKLLGRDCDDIDLALDNMTGLSFANAIRAALEERGELLHIGVIQANPEQSKHLETVAISLRGFAIDLVNLRSEEYSSGSRIPSDVHFGSPLSDAARRDLTINSMFYNLHTDALEDMTGRALADLEARRIDTPLEPLETLLDDPLRVLRAIRFGARFDYDIAERLSTAMCDQGVQAQLSSKISRERVLRELASMIGASGAAPVRAFRQIHALRLHEAIFLADFRFDKMFGKSAPPPDESEVERAARTHEASRALRGATGHIESLHAILSEDVGQSAGPCVDRRVTRWKGFDAPNNTQQALADKWTAEVEAAAAAAHVASEVHTPYAETLGLGALLQNMQQVHADKSERFRVWMATALLPLAPRRGGRDLAESVMRQGLRGMTSADILAVQRMHAHAPDFEEMALRRTMVEGRPTNPASRRELGMLLRASGKTWRSTLQLALVRTLPPLEVAPTEAQTKEWRGRAETVEVVRAFAQLSRHIEKQKLQEVWALLPLLDGNELMANGVPKGRAVGIALAELVAWQLEQPEATRSDALAWLKLHLAEEP